MSLPEMRHRIESSKFAVAQVWTFTACTELIEVKASPHATHTRDVMFSILLIKSNLTHPFYNVVWIYNNLVQIPVLGQTAI